MANQVFIGIGSNLGTPLDQCREAIGRILEDPHITLTTLSSFYKTEPVGPMGQNWFVNAVMEVETSLAPASLLSNLLRVEQNMGRVRQEKWGPRLIDLDLLFYGDSVLDLQGLQVPHPEIENRRFVLAPLAEIAAAYVHPVAKKTVGELLGALPLTPKVERLPALP